MAEKPFFGFSSGRSIAQKIIDKKADYILALKGNQGTLRDDVESLFLQKQKTHGYALQKVDQFASVNKDHVTISPL